MIDAWSPMLDRWPCSTKTVFIQVGIIKLQILSFKS